MGTMGYMCPRAAGDAVDTARNLLVGAILYEMLSGQKACKRDTSSDRRGDPKEDQPELTKVGRNISPRWTHRAH